MNDPAPSAINRTMTPVQWGMLVGLAVLWGGSFLFVEVAVAALPVFTVVALRVALGALGLLAVLRISGERLPRDPSVWRALFLLAVLNNVLPFTLFGWGQMHIASGLAAILNATTPLFAATVAHFATADEPFTLNRGLGVLIGLVGVAVMFGPSAFEGLGVNTQAELACLAAALCYAVAGVYGRRFGGMGLGATATATGQLICSSAIMIALALALDRPWTLSVPAWPVIASILALAVLSTSLAYVIYYRLLRQAGATNTLLVTILVPVFAVFFGATLLHERLEPRHFVGLGLILLGLSAIDGRLWAALRRALRIASRTGQA